MEKMRIFLSYSHRDKELAHKFHDHLCGQGFEIMWDENTIVVGDDFNKKLKKALYEADVYLPIISENFENSSFTQSELLAAIGYNNAREHPRLFPYIVFGNNIPHDLSSALCVMGTPDIEQDLKKVVAELNKLQGLLYAEQDTNSETKVQLNTSLEAYLKDVFSKLERNEKKNKTLAFTCYVFSALFLISIVVFSVSKLFVVNTGQVDVMANISLLIKSLAILSVLAALSRLAFILGKSFMVESIRNGDRIHAISFGKFFIQAYGDKATRQEIREVLGEWNIDKGSSFHTQDAKDIDPNFYGALELLKSYFDKK